MQFPPRQDAPREDLRLLQRAFDLQARYEQARREAADLGHNEPPLVIGLALLLFLAVVLTFAVAALPAIAQAVS